MFTAYRDELNQVAAYMPNIKEIRVLSREEKPPHLVLHNEWAGKGEVPKVMQGILKPDMVKWDDYADWDSEAWSCTWRIATRAFTDSVKCVGTTKLTEEGPGKTRVTLSGTLDLKLDDIPGVPRILAGRIAPQVEKFIIALITPNLEQVNASLGRYLDAH